MESEHVGQKAVLFFSEQFYHSSLRSAFYFGTSCRKIKLSSKRIGWSAAEFTPLEQKLLFDFPQYFL